MHRQPVLRVRLPDSSRGWTGWRTALTACRRTFANPYDDDAERLPVSLLAAIERFEASEMYRAALGHEFVSYLSRLKPAEWDRYLRTVSEWEHMEYFTAF